MVLRSGVGVEMSSEIQIYIQEPHCFQECELRSLIVIISLFSKQHRLNGIKHKRK